MSFLVPKPKMTASQEAATQPVAPVEQTDVANRQALARTRRLAGGGSATTILGSAMASQGAQGRSAVTGTGG